MKTTFLYILKIVFIFASLNLFSEDASKTNIWFLGGHMQHLFEKEYLKPMLNAGYDLTPMHEIKTLATNEGFCVLMADPNAISLIPFSHERSGIAAIAAQKQNITQEALKRASEDFKYIIVFEVMAHQITYLKQYPKEKLILFLWEPPTVMPQNYDPKNHEIFSKVYTWNDHLVDNAKYHKFFYPVLLPMINETIPFESKKLCTMIAGNLSSQHPNELYTARRNLANFFETHHPQDFDLYGKWWPTSYQTYKGPIDNKINYLKQYKFCIAYENAKNIPGYITEKIFNAFQAGTVPIYLGASNINDYIPKTCYIDGNEFADEAALFAYMKNMSKEKHEQYIKDIKIFLESEPAKVFSGGHFINTVMKQIRS